MKKISLELQWAIGEKTGIGWYIYNIVKELSKSDKNEYIAEGDEYIAKLRNYYDNGYITDDDKYTLSIKK